MIVICSILTDSYFLGEVSHKDNISVHRPHILSMDNVGSHRAKSP